MYDALPVNLFCPALRRRLDLTRINVKTLWRAEPIENRHECGHYKLADTLTKASTRHREIHLHYRRNQAGDDAL